MTDRVIIAGIDEAGYGPILGPLVVSATAFEAPAELEAACLWEALRDSVTEGTSSRGGRVPIADSKKLYQRAEGLGRLERSVLAMVAAWRGMPPTVHDLLRLLCPAVLDSLTRYPWYLELEAPLPRAADAGSVRIAARRVKDDLSGRRMRIAGLWTEVLAEGEYNRQVAATDNKAVVLLSTTLRLAHRAAHAQPAQAARIVIDKQGARDHYGPALMRSFEDRRLRIEAEGDERSAYCLTGGGAALRIEFAEGGESRHLPTALASMVSKYVRELLMEAFNAYWARQAPGIRPTAGYYQDGHRFLREVRPFADRAGIDVGRMVRTR